MVRQKHHLYFKITAEFILFKIIVLNKIKKIVDLAIVFPKFCKNYLEFLNLTSSKHQAEVIIYLYSKEYIQFFGQVHLPP